MEIDQCVEKIVSGDTTYFNILVKQLQTPIYTLVVRMIGDRDLAKDLTQDIFLKVYKNLATYNRSVKITTWIYTIATNTCIDYLRKKKDVLLFEDRQQLEIEHKVYALPEKFLENQELRQHIYEKIDLLPEHYRIIVILKYVNELTFEEIASVLDQPTNTIKTKLYRAKEMLKAHLSETWMERSEHYGM